MTTTKDRTAWSEVTKSEPCPICKRDTWCRRSSDGDRVACRREPNGGTRKTYRDGTEYFLHILRDDRPGSNGHARQRHPERQRSGVLPAADTRDRAYRLLLDHLALSDDHRAALRRRGLADEVIDANGYRTLPADTHDVALSLLMGLVSTYDQIPGFKKYRGRAVIASRPGLLIPVRDVEGRVVAIKVRDDDPNATRRYAYLTSRSKRNTTAPSPGSPAHVPHGITGPCELVRITEGELKADVATHLSRVPTVSFPGVSTWRTMLPVLEALAAKTVRLAFDADATTNDQVAKALAACYRELCRRGYTVELERWQLDDGKGIDDLLVAGGTPEVLVGDAAKEVVGDCDASDKPRVFVGMDEAAVARAVLTALGNLGWDEGHDARDRVYQRVGRLVHITETSDDVCGVELPANMLRIRQMPPALIRERIASAVLLEGPTDREGEPSCIRPPGWLVAAIDQRGQYPRDIRPLSVIVRCPTLRPDGTVVQIPGYDAGTGIVLAPDGTYPAIPEHPTRDDAIRAAGALLDVVVDFPFCGPAHRSAWLAMVLTLVGRSAIRGPCPMFVIDANCPGTGKSLLTDVAGVIAYGDRLPRKPWPGGDDAEVRKTITSVAMEALPAVLWDNVGSELGCSSLDAALTGTSWTDRLLGTNQTTGTLPLTTVWAATGNNVVLAGDAPRRALLCRLETDLDNPEERDDFHHANLSSWVREHRHKLAVDAVTILWAYVAAGRPRQAIPVWGSYEAWSDLVRHAIVWAGLPDPWETRAYVRASDRSRELLGMIHDGIVEADPDRAGVTSGQIVKLLDDHHPQLCAAITELCGPKIDGRHVGYSLRPYVGRVRGGRRLCREVSHGGVAKWLVRSINPPGSGGAGGHGGHGGHVSNPARERNTTPNRWEGEIEKWNGHETSPPCPPSPPHGTCPTCSFPLTERTTFDGYTVIECTACDKVYSTRRDTP